MTRVGVAGLGRMGAPMAVNLSQAGFSLMLWNRSREKATALADEIGAEVADTPRAVAEGCDIVITMLADDDASRAVHFGEGGLFASTGGSQVFAEMGTLSVEHVRELQASASQRLVIDAPVSGSIDAAGSAQLLIMAGTDAETGEVIRPALEAMSRQIVWLGQPGAAATMKLAVNLMIHSMNQSLSEALALAEANGVEAALAYEVIENSAAAAPMIGYRKPQYLAEADNPVSFALSLARKDLELAVELATATDVALPQTELNLAQLRSAEADGFGERDMAAVLAFLRSHS